LRKKLNLIVFCPLLYLKFALKIESILYKRHNKDNQEILFLLCLKGRKNSLH